MMIGTKPVLVEVPAFYLPIKWFELENDDQSSTGHPHGDYNISLQYFFKISTLLAVPYATHKHSATEFFAFGRKIQQFAVPHQEIFL